MKGKFLLAILIVFAMVGAAAWGLHTQWPDFREDVIWIGNGLLLLLTLLTFWLASRQINERPAAFVRGVYSATMIKLLVCIGLVLVYVLGFRKDVHKPSLFVLFGVYFLYTTVETIFLSRLARRKPD